MAPKSTGLWVPWHPRARSARSSTRRDDAILKIVLFGSYARGDWVEDPVGRYFSDYDLLVVVADEKHTDVWDYWAAAEKQLLNALASGERLRAWSSASRRRRVMPLGVVGGGPGC